MRFWNDLTKLEQKQIIDEVKATCWIRENADWNYQCYFEDPEEYNRRWREYYLTEHPTPA